MRQIDMRARVAFTLLVGCAASGCGIVGFRYRYAGSEYTMTKTNSDYHQAAVTDVRTRYGDFHVEEDPQKLAGACKLLEKYATDAPDPGQFTPARELLDNDARDACGRAQRATRAAEAEKATAEHHQAMKQEAANREENRRNERTSAQRQQLEGLISRDAATAETCQSSAAARDARKRHAEILRASPDITVQKSCTPRRGTVAVRSECKDENGFSRACTKNVAGDVVSYVCPKTMDPEVVALGQFKLDLLDDYPFPADRSIRVTDASCDEAARRLAENRQKLEALATPTTNAMEPR